MILACVVGSAARSHRTRNAVEVAAAGAVQAVEGLKVEVIDLSQSKVAMADGRDIAEYGDDTAAVVAAITKADCVLLSTPIYRGTYTGALKNLLDHLALEALEGKAVGLLATGATADHSLAVDLQLRGVLAWFNAYLVPGSVYLTHADVSGDRISEDAVARLAELGASTVELAQCIPKGPPRPYSLARRMMKSPDEAGAAARQAA